MSAGRLDPEISKIRHAGLYLDKFIPQERKSQTAALKALAALQLNVPAYRLAFERWKSHWQTRGSGVLIAEAVVRDRMAIGLGAESVLENGLRLHFTYGTPLIPASSLKGILRRGLPEVHRDGHNPWRPNVEWYLFGDTGRAGQARFYDAWWMPEAQSPLVTDVLTPHHQAYMDRKAPPTDFDEPVPVSFLTVRGTFLFVIETPNESWRNYMKELLKDTLVRDGVGSKRSAGYGTLDPR